MRPARVRRRDEVSRAGELLKNPEVQGDPMRKRKAMQKVMALMTVGMDTSSLFMDVILACFTPDLVTKKLIYLYLTTHSEANAELAVLTINTFVKEFSEDNPLVRGLALRSLAALRVPQLLEYLMPALQTALGDYSPYVRRIAVLCALRVYRQCRDEYVGAELHGKLIALLRDPDTHVCLNALQVLREITLAEAEAEMENPVQPTFSVTKALMYHLLNQLPRLTEWLQIRVVDLLIKYTPETEEEMFDLMNALEDRLRSNNSGLVIAVSRAFLHLTQNNPDVHLQVFDRLRRPLIALMSSTTNVEAAYAVLCHVRLLVKREPAVFRRYYKDFYCRYSEPSYMKMVKIAALADLVDPQSAPLIVKELAAYAEDRVGYTVTTAALSSMCKIALRLPEAAPHVLSHFLNCLRLGTNSLRCATLVAMKDFLRTFRAVETVRPVLDVLLVLYDLDGGLPDDESQQSFVWVMGEFGELVERAPYILEALCADLLSRSAEFRLQMLTSAATLFFKRPAEMQPVLGRVLKILIDDFSSADVLDKALLYYRLLSHDVVTAAQVICGPKVSVSAFVEDEDANHTDRFFEEFGSLSVVYGIPSEKFMATEPCDELEVMEGDHDGNKSTTPSSSPTDDGQHASMGNDSADALWEGVGQLQQRAASTSLALSETVELSPAQYQQHWNTLTASTQLHTQLRTTATVEVEPLEEHFADHSIFTLASGKQGEHTRMYLYAGSERCAEDDALYLVEVLVSPSGLVDATVKSRGSRGADFVDYLQSVFSTF